MKPPVSDADLRELCADAPDFYDAVWGGRRPIIWRLTRIDPVGS